MSTQPSPQGSKLTLSLKRFRQRRLGHQLKVISIVSAGLLLVIPPLARLSAEAWHSLAPRSPLGGRVPVTLCADHISDEGRVVLRQRPEGVALHQVKPRLTLVGVGERLVELNTPSCQQGFEVGLLPQHAELLLREGTQMSLAVEAPSLTLLVEELINAPRGQALQAQVSQTKDTLAQEALTLLPQLQEQLKSKLDPTLATKLIKDEVLLSALKAAVSSELINRVNWSELGEGISDSKELDQLLDLATKHVRKSHVFRGIWSGFKEGASQGKADLIKRSAQVNQEGFWWWDTTLCTLQTGALGITLMNPSLQAVSNLALVTFGGSSELCGQVISSGKGVVKGAIKGGATNFAKESFKSLKKESDQALSEAQKLAAGAWERAEGGARLKGLWLAIAGNQALKDHITNTYGAPAWTQLQEAVWSVSQNQEVEALINQAGERLKQLSKKALTALLLDREGKGPNPLLLAVIQEQLSGQARPIVHVTPAPPENPRVSPGYLFMPPSTQSTSTQEGL